jgi:tripeptidyl-peptidase-1
VQPTADTLSAVTEWLTENDIVAKSVSPAGDLLQITLPVSKANTLLATEFAAFQHTATGKQSIRTLSYSVPAALQSHIKFVHPTVAFIPPLSKKPKITAFNPRKRTTIPASCQDTINPVL